MIVKDPASNEADHKMHKTRVNNIIILFKHKKPLGLSAWTFSRAHGKREFGTRELVAKKQRGLD